jgi:ATP-dependent DNA helicase RecQ
MSKTDNLLNLLQNKFQLQEFRSGQLEVIQAILARQDVLCIMPTGYGKSLCYQLSSLLLDGVTVVVSPLVALMKDQVDSLHAKGFKEATFINSSVTIEEQRARLQALKTGQFRLVYISPERFRSRAFLLTLKAIQIALFVVDESHCISQWGHDFRPDYLALKAAIATLGKPQVAAFTATATSEVRRDIKQQLDIITAQEFLHSIGRESLEFFVFPVTGDEDKLLWIQHLVKSIGGKGIIYAGKRRDCEYISNFLVAISLRAEYFHAKREEPEKKSIQERFMNDDHPQSLDVIAATNAFGLGVDKANIRFVIHSAITGTVEEYFQEAGRAGRDGLRAFCILLYSYDDRSLQEWFIENSLVDQQELIRIYETIKSIPSLGDFRVIPYDDLYWRLRLSETKIRVGISHLERLGLIRRFPDVDSQIHLKLVKDVGYHAIDNSSVHGGKKRMILAILEQAHAVDRLELVNFCVRHHFEPLGVVEMLYDLEFEDVIRFHRSQRAMLLRLEQGVRPLQKMDPKEIGFEEYRQHKYDKLDKMLHYAESNICRVRYIREYFGEQVTNDCGRCDNCRARKGWQRSKKPEPKEIKAEVAVSEKLDYFNEELLNIAILLTVKGVQGHAGKNIVADILKGSKAKTVLNWSFDKLSTYNRLPYFRKEALVETIKMLILKGLIQERRTAEFDYPLVHLSAKGEKILSEWRAKCGMLNWLPEPLALSASDEKIFQSLKKFRLAAADNERVLPFQVLHDSMLREIAITKPKNLSQLAFIRGLSPNKINKYGAEIMRVLSVHFSASETGRERFKVQDIQTVKKFIRGKLSHALVGEFDIGYALSNHTVIQEGVRQYTPLGQMVYEFKYQQRKSHVDALVAEMVKFLEEADDYQRIDLVVAVPCTLGDREFDPVGYLVTELNKRTGLSLGKEVLIKTRPTRPQKELVNITQKTVNVKGAFKVENHEKIRDKNILLIDDLYDSGATLNECTQVLKSAGARKVLVLTLTRTMHAN